MGSLRAGGENEDRNRNAFTWTNLQSDIAGVADRTDSNLINSWGLALNGSRTIFWVADNGTGVSTLYQPDGTPVPNPKHPLVVTIPPPAGSPAGTTAAPTGIVFNSNPKDFSGAFFIFATEDGTIATWNPADGTNAVRAVDNSASGAVYKGLGLVAKPNGGSRLYATNFHNGTVDVFDTNFSAVTTPGGFTDPNLPTNFLPAKFAPFGIANIGGQLYVTFALQKLPDRHDDQSGDGNGFVDVFDNDGHLLERLITQGPLNSPWGLALVPAGVGEFRHKFGGLGEFRHKFGGFGPGVLLVGNFGDGRINAFDISNVNKVEFLGPLNNRRGDPLEFNGLWALVFLDDRLYFTAGIGDESHGLFGFIRAVERGDGNE